MADVDIKVVSDKAAIPFSHHLYTFISIFFVFMIVVSDVCAGNKTPSFTDLHVPAHITAEKVNLRLTEWQQFIRRTMHYSEAEKIKAVNNYINRLRFIEDLRLWKQSDYWASPLQLLAVGAGDCEDFAIAKFFALKALGISIDKLRVTYVWRYKNGRASRESHMVLTYNASTESDYLVLDNLMEDIKPMAQRQDLQPVYAFNTEKLWLPGEYKIDVEAGNPAQLAQWRALDKRLKHDLVLLGL